jgi:integrase
MESNSRDGAAVALWQRGRSWYYDFWYRGKRHAGCLGPVSKPIAKAQYARIRVDVAEGKDPPVRQPAGIFQEFAVEFLKHYRATRRPSSTLSCVSHVRIFSRYFGGKRLTDITVQDVQTFQADQVRQGKAPASVNRYVGILSQLFALAIQWNQLSHNPVEAVVPLKVRNARTRFLSDEEEDILLKACGETIKPVVITAIHTGLRRTKLATLTWKDVNLQRRVVRVRPEPAKSGVGREVPMDRTVYALLSELKPTHTKGTDPVFKSKLGLAFRKLSVLFGYVIKRTELTDLRFHDLRHTFASRLVMRGADLRTVQELMGHQDIRMTQRYAHLSASHKQNVVYLLDRKSKQFSQQSDSQGVRFAAEN